MAVQLVLNFIIAVFWLFVTNSYTTNNFVLGFIFGLVLVYLLHRVLPGRFYVITLYRIIKLVIIFLIELIKANFDVLKIIIKPSIKNEPGFFVYHTDLKKDWQIVLLSNLITLTPGTVGGRNIMNHNVIIVIALIIVVISMLAMLIRVVLGPSLADRVVALDAIGLQLMAVIALFSILLNIKYMIVVIMMIGILAFLGTAVFSKFMDKGKVIEHDQNHTD